MLSHPPPAETDIREGWELLGSLAPGGGPEEGKAIWGYSAG